MVGFHQIEKIQFVNDLLILDVDGKTYEIELKKISEKLLTGKAFERNIYTIAPSGYGIHWTLLNEDLAIDALIEKAN